MAEQENFRQRLPEAAAQHAQWLRRLLRDLGMSCADQELGYRKGSHEHGRGKDPPSPYLCNSLLSADVLGPSATESPCTPYGALHDFRALVFQSRPENMAAARIAVSSGDMSPASSSSENMQKHARSTSPDLFDGKFLHASPSVPDGSDWAVTCCASAPSSTYRQCPNKRTKNLSLTIDLQP